MLVFDEAPLLIILKRFGYQQSTLSTGGNSIILSTPNGVGNFFHRTWVGSEEETNGFNPIKLHWSVHPERNEDWRQNQETLLGPKGGTRM